MQPASPSTLASAAYTLVSGGHPEEAMSVVEVLLETGRLDASAVVCCREHPDDEPREMPLLDALRARYSHDDCAPLRTAAMANRLLDVDPGFFSPPSAPGWLWKHLVSWSIRDFDKHGFHTPRVSSSGAEDGADHWAAAIVGRLPESALSALHDFRAWDALIRLRFPRTMVALGKRCPGMWAIPAEMSLARARGSWVIDLLHDPEAGASMWSPQADGRPLWRHLAPALPSRIPDEDSLVAAVERWAGTDAAADLPGRRAILDRFLLGGLLSRMCHGEWRMVRFSSRLRYIDRLPLSWVHDGWPGNGDPCPLWARPFMFTPLNPSREEEYEAVPWAKALLARPALCEAIGPLADFACWLVLSHKPTDMRDVPGTVVEAARHPHAAQLLEALAVGLPSSCPGKEGIIRQGESLLLHIQAPCAPSIRPPGPRL